MIAEMTKSLKAKRMAAWALLTVVLDQASKLAAIVFIASDAVEVEILPFLSFVLSFNTGVSFGLFADTFGHQQIVVAAILLVVTLGIGALAFGRNPLFPPVGTALIVGGSLGNVIDRFRQGAVTDFILLHYEGFAWPIFNLADSAIFLGCALIILGGQGRSNTRNPESAS